MCQRSTLQPELAGYHTDTAALDDHVGRRRALYRQLAIPDVAVRGARVLEVAPGHGDNAVHTASLGPARYDVFYEDPSSLSELEAKRVAGLLPRALRLLAGDVMDAPPTASFDLVIAEGVAERHGDPARTAAHLGAFVAPGGCLLLTTRSITSHLAVLCRRLVVQQVADRVSSWHHDQLVSALSELWQPSFAVFPASSWDDAGWVLDNLVSPWAETSFFSALDAANALGADFELFSMSPALLQDDRFLPTLVHPELGRGETLRASFARWAPVLVDHRLGAEAEGMALDAVEAAAWRLYYATEALLDGDRGELAGAFEALTDLEGLLPPPTARSLTDFTAALEAGEAGDPSPDFGTFHQWWGRSPQHVLFQRKPGAHGAPATKN